MLWSRTQNGFGSLLPVSVQGCQIACAMTGAACNAVSYNPTLQACYLKAGTSAANCQARILPANILAQQNGIYDSAWPD